MKTKTSFIANSLEGDIHVVKPNSPIIEPDLIDIKYLAPSDQNERVKEEMDAISEEDNFLDYFKNYSTQHEEVLEVIIKGEHTDENLEDTINENSHICYKCGECFTLQSLLTFHTKMHCLKNKEEPIIKRSTLPLKRLNEQLSLENAKKRLPHICNVCDESFPNETSLKKHLNSHPGERPYKCNVCSKQFNFKNNLTRHMLLHGGGNLKDFPCDICNKVFTRKEHLNKHAISHTEELPHQCSICNKLFKYKDSLRSHLKYHNGEKRFCCKICGNGFIRRDNLHVHLRTVHANEKQPFGCPCKKDDLETCSYEERKKLNLERKFYKCKTCDKVCTTKQNLRIHSNIHLKEKPYKCNVCNGTFLQKGTLTLHLRVHTGEKPFICFLCEMSFRYKPSLRNHLQRHRNERGVFVKLEREEENTL